MYFSSKGMRCTFSERWNYAYRNLEVEYNEFSPKMVMYLGLFKEDKLSSREKPPPVIHHCIFVFWVVAKGRILL